ncbi:type II toxin-antitoxin system RelE/ParE family toxin [Mucilaginibacter sp. UYCu711]|uniref:type II toxin-antitoxin system RelE/ParE family toxin n=1 Tax=Mucilaginibacter sp. UYCu711 TaxID=3156339 RepID=UPI003D1E5E8C
MSFRILPLKPFLKELKHLSKKYPSIKDDLRKLGEDLALNPRSGVAIGKNCYKIRLQITSKGKGKSGGARIITHFLVAFENETLFLLKIYDKGDQENISDTELTYLLKSITDDK